MTTAAAGTPGKSPGLGRVGLYAMAAACGIAAANIYYSQPILGLMESEFPGQAAIGYVPTATQLGFALGLFFLLPLGDIVPRRRVIVGHFLALALVSIVVALAPTPPLLILASVALGTSAVVAQQIVPFAAHLAAPAKRGATIGVVMAGLLSGILLSRALSGFIGEHTGWRTIYWLGVPLALVTGLLMFAVLPNDRPTAPMRYGAALRSLARLWTREPELRTAALVQAALFGSFNTFWTILALYLASPTYRLGADIAGLFGIVGVAGILAAPLAGRIADRRGPHFVVSAGTILAVVAWAVFGLWESIAGLVVGVIALDLGIQSAMVSNQHIIYALDPEARSRINTVYMTTMFLGGAAGSALAALAWKLAGWHAVSILGVVLAVLAFAVRVILRRRARAG